MNIPLLIPCFNQLTYLRNLVNWFRFYSKGDIYILDNSSTYPPLREYLSYIHGRDNISVIGFERNDGADNLRALINEKISKTYEYYVISDPDVMPHPSVPADFLEVFRYCVDGLGYHHAGFCLKIDDLPDNIENKALILNNEALFWQTSVAVTYGGRTYRAYRAPIDTTFALYKSDRGWEKPLRPEWNNSLRMFEAFHLPWYIDPKRVNEEMDFYFKTARGPVSIYGKAYDLYANYRPAQYVRLHINNEIARALNDAAFMSEFRNYLRQKDPDLLKIVANIADPESTPQVGSGLMNKLSNEVLIFMREHIFGKAEGEEGRIRNS
jgi:hypothetical protein